MATDKTPISIEGIFVRDRHGWGDYHYLEGYTYITRWLKDRMHEIPDGAYVRFTAEIIDPERPPPPPRPRVDKPPATSI